MTSKTLQKDNITFRYRFRFCETMIVFAILLWNASTDCFIVQAQELEQAVPAPFLLQLRPAHATNQGQIDRIESWMFGGISAASARKKLEHMSDQRMLLLKEQCQLSDEQIQKFELAKRGDIARFFQNVALVRAEIGNRVPSRDNMAELGKVIAPVQRIWNTGLVGSESLFMSMLQATLTDEQKEALRLEQKRRLEVRNRYQAMAMIKLVEQSTPMNDKQRQTFLELIVSQAANVKVDAQYAQYVAIHTATKLSDETLGRFFDRTQLANFRLLQKHWEASLPFLNEMNNAPQALQNEEWLDVFR
ncbi:MAG: hypothetical protein SGI77_28025 [Pirellulaceae bacterium]|nr:hypothetical protein [Pirellulaceae bacterium]